VLSFVLKTFIVQSFFIPSQSMESTLLVDDRVMVSKLAPGLWDVHRGDIVVFQDPGDWLSPATVVESRGDLGEAAHQVLQWIGLAPSNDDSFLIKRVIGLPGDRVQCLESDVDANADGVGDPVVAVNGTELVESYVKVGQRPCTDLLLDFSVPAGALWVMGDNREHSGDSRAHRVGPLDGAVDLGLVVGVAKLRTWPVNRMAVLSNPGEVFAGVPAPAPAEGAPETGVPAQGETETNAPAQGETEIGAPAQGETETNGSGPASDTGKTEEARRP
ncbi:MAG: signal peptidase I, partial [Bifidobacteriaceae bacterium]|jgi:signal peptidase I|nr:signal peptidase I [Bifidobacteriaceae bacterium]